MLDVWLGWTTNALIAKMPLQYRKMNFYFGQSRLELEFVT